MQNKQTNKTMLFMHKIYEKWFEIEKQRDEHWENERTKQEQKENETDKDEDVGE